jgi:hypothetical protein
MSRVSRDRQLLSVLDSVANALQSAVLIAYQLQQSSAVLVRDGRRMNRSLRRATKALQKLQPHS